eukprot:9404973-Alexandrium_andersonii.AAC.1
MSALAQSVRPLLSSCDVFAREHLCSQLDIYAAPGSGRVRGQSAVPKHGPLVDRAKELGRRSQTVLQARTPEARVR